MKPTTQYTKSGHINIAYQVFGSGDIDIVYIPGWVSNIDWMWACPELVDFLLEMGKIGRVILFDKRGTGLSDRIVELSTLEERMDDIRAVMDAVGSEKAVLFGHSEGGSVSALFAATYPDRTLSLITFGIFAKRRRTASYPWAPSDEERQQLYHFIEKDWGSDKLGFLKSLAPSKAHDAVFMKWISSYLWYGANPSAALILTKMNTQIDIIDILGTINVPTLIMQRTHDIDVNIEEGRFIANRIRGSKFVEFEGNDHLFWVGNAENVLEEMKTFIFSTKLHLYYEKTLFTILTAKIVAFDSTSERTHSNISHFIGQYGGKVLHEDDHTVTAIFKGPSKAVHCGLTLIDAFNSANTQLAAAIHIKECRIDNPVNQETRDIFKLILAESWPGQLVITQTVKHLLSETNLSFSALEKFVEPLSKMGISLFLVVDDLLIDQPPEDRFVLNKDIQYFRNDSFLESVLECIDVHLENQFFGVERLCLEIGTSERQLQRKLKALTNKSPNQLITSVRLHRAKELILKRSDNISGIAYKTGFASPSYFSKRFKEEFGSSPSSLV